MEQKFDFSGWATKHDVMCSDGRIIRKDAFKHQDRKRMPLVWNHQHGELSNVLGHADLEYRPEGVYAYCSFNDTPDGQLAKELVKHGDISSLSIYANKLKQVGSDVMNGMIREVSLVLASANPEAYIDTVAMAHGDGEEAEYEGFIYSGEPLEINHSDEEDPEDKTEEPDDKKEAPENKKEEPTKTEPAKEAPSELSHADKSAAKTDGETAVKKEDTTMAKEPEKTPETEKTVQDVFDTLNEEQKTVVFALIGQALSGDGDNEEEDADVKHNVFDNEETQENTLSHADMEMVFKDAKRLGSLRDSFLEHTDIPAPTYGVGNMDYMFPDAQTMNNVPDFISREMGWVRKVMGAVHTTPFSRIKSIHADITEDEARAKGYLKGKLKKDEVFSLLKRATTPTTVYKKQKLDRDDIIDIVDFDVVVWLKAEMRMMLDEELARAFLVGDGRLSSLDDKINEGNIRPIWTDSDLYTIKADVTVSAAATSDEKAKAFERAAVKSRKNYKGSGNPILFTTEDMLTDMLLREDSIGHKIYKTVDELATALRVREIVTVPVMENLTRVRADTTEVELLGIIVNLTDYNVGADKGGAVSMFDDFDIDYNQQKYLIETRCSGALIKPYSAIALEMVPEVADD